VLKDRKSNRGSAGRRCASARLAWVGTEAGPALFPLTLEMTAECRRLLPFSLETSLLAEKAEKRSVLATFEVGER
jgi:hypothetical protein